MAESGLVSGCVSPVLDCGAGAAVAVIRLMMMMLLLLPPHARHSLPTPTPQEPVGGAPSTQSAFGAVL